MKSLNSICMAALLALGVGAPVRGAPTWTEGVNYFLVQPARPAATLPPGKVQVTEVFSYACPACNVFRPSMRKLVQTLPANAVIDYLPATFNPSEDWPMFALAYRTAQVLGVADNTHESMYDAVWSSRELAVIDASNRIRSPLPTIEDAAKFYNKSAGVPVDKFLATSKSFTVDLKMRSDEGLLRAYGIDRTPTIIVNGKYRVHVQSAGGDEQLLELVKWLVAKEIK